MKGGRGGAERVNGGMEGGEERDGRRKVSILDSSFINYLYFY